MPTLVDTNVLGRRAQPSHPMHPAATAAIDRLMEREEPLYVAVQNLMEFWAVATRPASANGLGLSPDQAALELEAIEQVFELLPETAEVYPAWRKLVREVGVSGRQVHDAHLASTMLAHGIPRILTFDVSDFARYPGITALDPATVSTTA